MRKAVLLFALLAFASYAFAGGQTCEEFLQGNLVPGSGICTGNYNKCTYIDYQISCSCPDACWNAQTFSCGNGMLLTSCSLWNDRQAACEARSGCTWTAYNPCASLDEQCNSITPCCTGLVCSATSGQGSCKLQIGALCSSSNECITGYCNEPIPGASGVCCVGQGQSCIGDSQCCSGMICRAASQNSLKTCLPCATQNQYCSKNGDCCNGLSCISNKCAQPPPANQPPEAPPAPEISPSNALMLHPQGEAECSSNCPPSIMPTDPEGHEVRMQYLWHKNNQPVGDWGPYSIFVCPANGCQVGQTIYLKSRACDQFNACSESISNSLAVQAPVPASLPNAPAIAPLGQKATPGTGARCINCPPMPIPIDPITGNPAAIQYSWVKNGNPSQWSSSYYHFSCPLEGCLVGDQIYLRIRACSPSSPSTCTGEVSSSTLVVEQQAAVSTGAFDMVYSIYAIGAAIGIIALAFMASYIFNLPHIRPIIQDELLQVFATGGVLLGIVGVNSAVDNYMVYAMGTATTASVSSIQGAMDAANSVLSDLEGKALAMYNEYSKTGADLGREGSKGIFCNFLGVGYTIVNCSPLNAFRGTVTTAAFAATGALADVYAQKYLLSLARNLSFSFLIPLGLFMRCFKISRGAGGALIAIGFGFYTVYPLTIVAANNLLHGSNHPTPYQMPSVTACDPAETNTNSAKGDVLNFAYELTEYDRVENMIYIILVRVIFVSILAIMITLAFIRAFAHTIGSEIDVSALARIS